MRWLNLNDEYVNNWRKANELQDVYRHWKLNSMDESGYFLIFQGFLETDILKHISGNALRLYIYLGIRSNNFAGVVWHSNERIAAYFNKSERTIRLWMKELQDNKLIKRMRLEYDGRSYTFLLPYKINSTDKYLKEIEGLLVNKNKKIYIFINNEYLPVSSGLYIEIYDNITQEWILGRIYAYKNDTLFDEFNDEFDGDIEYVFKAINCFYEKDLGSNISLKIRATI